MNILFLSDWHSHIYPLAENKVDLLIALGDFDWKIIDKIDKQFQCPKIGLLGNHDRNDTYRGTGFIHLHEKKIEIDGLTIAGFDGCPRYNSKKTPQYEERDVSSFTRNLGYVDIFISHANPKWDTDEDRTDAHRGFASFTEYIEKERPMYFAHGHNHVDKQFQYRGTEILSVFPSYLLDMGSFS